MNPTLRRTAFAAACALCASTSHAQNDDEAAVVVTATRFPALDPRVPAITSVITREELRANPAVSLPELLRNRAGLEVRGLNGILGIDATVDLRGFGESAGSNTLILLDGQRLNPADSGAVTWSSIPLESIRRIEIVRGGGTVLYGDRATGGVINIITDKSGQPSASATASAGQYGYRAVQASAAGSGESAYFSVFGQYRESDGYRRNNQQDQRAASGRAGYRWGSDAEAFLDYSVYSDSNGSPGALFRAQYESDPRQARFAFDTQSREGWRLRPGVVYELAPTLRLEAEASFDDARLRSDIPSGLYRDTRDREGSSLTPRVRWRHGLGALSSETVAGVDLYDGDVEARSESGYVGANRQTAEQASRAFYFQNTTELTQELALTLGFRTQRVRQEATDEAAGLRGEATRTRNAGEIGASWQATDQLRLVARAGQTFRFANLDELFGFDPFTFVPVFRGDLKPQHGTNYEIGADWRSGPVRLKSALYQLDLRDEIGFDYVTFTNDNLPRTRRTGFEIEADWQPAQTWRIGAAYTWQDPTFREGPDAGKAIPLTARHKGSLSLRWNGADWGNHTVSVVAVGERWYGGDTANTRERLASYAVVDYQGSWDLRPWTLTVRLLNAFDKRYAPFAGYSVFARDYFYYPADGRAAFLSARYDFR